MWRCFDNCGECCKDVVITSVEYHRLGFPEVEAHGQYYLIKGPCPFLTEDKRCSVYKDRPLNCHNFFCGRESMSQPVIFEGDRCITHDRRVARDKQYRKQVLKARSKHNRQFARAGGW